MGSDSVSYSSRGQTGNDDSDDSDYNVSHYPQPTCTSAANAFNNSGGRVMGDSDEDDELNNNVNQENDQLGANGGEDSQSSLSFGAYRTHRGHHRGHKESREAEAEAAAAAQAAAQLEAQQNEALKEIEDHKKRLQLYVLICRCIAYPFIAKQPTDMVRRQPKITKQQLLQIKVLRT